MHFVQNNFLHSALAHYVGCHATHSQIWQRQSAWKASPKRESSASLTTKSAAGGTIEIALSTNSLSRTNLCLFCGSTILTYFQTLNRTNKVENLFNNQN